MFEQTNLIPIAIVLAISLPIILLVSAVLLRAGVSMYNRFVGGRESPKAVPEPSFNKAMGIVLLVGVINSLIGTVFGRAIGLVADGGWLNDNWADTATMVPSFALGLIVMAAVLKFLLPTRMACAIGVSLCHTVVCGCVAVVTLLVGFSVAVVMAAMT